MRSVCFLCFKDLHGVAESTTVDCKSGLLAGCGVRFCSLKCLVASSKRAHADVCGPVQRLLKMFREKHYRSDIETHNAAVRLSNSLKGGHDNSKAQTDLLAADLIVNKHHKAATLQNSSQKLHELGALRLALESVVAASKLVKAGTADAAKCYNNMGNVLQTQGKLDAAMEKYEAALAIKKKVDGEEHADVAGCYINMGNVLQTQGQLDEAMEKYKAALAIYKKAHGEEHANVATCYNNMGNVLQKQGKLDEAVVKYEAALAIRSKVPGGGHLVANCLDNMGNVLKKQGKLDEAMEKYKAALAIFEKAGDKAHFDLATCYLNMGNVLQAQGKLDEAMEKYKAALAILKKVYG